MKLNPGPTGWQTRVTASALPRLCVPMATKSAGEGDSVQPLCSHGHRVGRRGGSATNALLSRGHQVGRQEDSATIALCSNGHRVGRRGAALLPLYVPVATRSVGEGPMCSTTAALCSHGHRVGRRGQRYCRSMFPWPPGRQAWFQGAALPRLYVPMATRSAGVG